MDVVSRFAIAVLAVVSLCWQANAAELFDGESPTNFLRVPQGVSDNEALQAVAKAAMGRKWSLIDANNEFVTINLKHHGYDATLKFFVTDDQLVYLDSTVQKLSRKHEHTEIHPDRDDAIEQVKAPKRWVSYLVRDTRKSLNNLAGMNALKAEEDKGSNTETLKSKLVSLKSMYDEGLIDKSEYQAKKDEILAQF